jgi:biopolymer transport protein ExbD
MNALVKALQKNQQSTFGLQITSMIDMFTIILVFLLKSYAASSVDLTPSKNLILPASTSQEAAVEALKMTVTAEAIFVDDKEVMKVDLRSLSSKDEVIKPLYDSLMVQAQKSKNIASKNDSVIFEGKVIMQADQSLNYAYLKKVMYTAALAGYSDFKFAVIAR